MKLGATTKILLAACTLLAWSGPVLAEAFPPADPGPALIFAPRVEINSEDRVTLLDLLQPGQVIPDPLKDQLAGLTVTVSPGLGRGIAVTASKVKALLRQVNLGAGTEVGVPETMMVVRACQRLSTERMVAIYIEGVRERLGARAAESDIHDVQVGRELVLPLGEISTNLRFMRSGLLGRTPAVLEVMVDGQRRAEARMMGTVDLYAEVVVASRSLMQRHVVGPEDIEMARANLNEIGPGAVFDPQDVLGMRTLTVVPLGAPLDVTHMDRSPLIRLGDVVVMVYDLGGVRVTAKGRAEQTGFLHGRIRLTNLISKRGVWGKVVDSGSVVVE